MEKELHIVGREAELDTLRELLDSYESELVSVIGRRRVGKTFLVQAAFNERIVFEITGLQHASNREQLENFSTILTLYSKAFLPVERPQTWLEAFRLLIMYLEQVKTDDKRVVFFDELPWLAARRSGFLNAFSFFWNSWAVKNNIIVVICGSAASWMIQKIVHNKGGLYNRITKRIYLYPFTLHETEVYLQKRRLNWERQQVVSAYMAIGGIPHYLKELKRSESVSQNIDRICFDRSGPLFDEFKQLYPSLFEHSENHIALARALASKRTGLSRNVLAALTGYSDGGGLSKALEELQYSGFISEYRPFGRKKRETLFRLTDEYTYFYLKFIENMEKEGAGVWKSFQKTPAYYVWSGYAFESLCLKHLAQIKKALGIEGVFTISSAFYHKGKEGMKGCQIDLLIDRDDQVINLCEMKWTSNQYIVSKEDAAEWREKIALFRYYSGTKKQIIFTLLTPFGLLPNEHSNGIVDKTLTLEALFKA